jgi:Recombination protein U
MTPEAKVKKDIRAYLDSLGPQCRYFMPQNMGMGESGVADFVGVYAGQPFAFEAKRADVTGPNVEYATPWQFRFLREWKAAGGIAAVVRSEHRVRAFLQEFAMPSIQPIDDLQPDRTE